MAAREPGYRLLLAPSLSVLGVLFALPLVLLFVISFWSVRSFQLRPDFNLTSYGRLVTDYSGVLLSTLLIGALVASLCVIVGFIFAYGVRFKAGRFADGLILIMMLTMFGGYLVKVYAWKSILGADGIINSLLLNAGLIDKPLPWLIYNAGAVTVTLFHALLPLAVLPIYAALRNVREETLEAARDLGANPLEVIGRVVLPQIRGGLFAAFALTFLIASGDYVTPQYLGGDSGSMLGRFIEQEFSTRFNWPAGAAFSFSLLAACMVVIAGVWLLMDGLLGNRRRRT
jgi:spermidine/putrescine transport system permease protein